MYAIIVKRMNEIGVLTDLGYDRTHIYTDHEVKAGKVTAEVVYLYGDAEVYIGDVKGLRVVKNLAKYGHGINNGVGETRGLEVSIGKAAMDSMGDID